MALANIEFAQTATEVAHEAAKGGLPQLNVIADGSFTNQIAWLLVTFFFLFLIVWRLVLPRVTSVLEVREEKIANDLDAARRLKTEAEDMKAAYEATVADARAKAQEAILGAKETIQADIAAAETKLNTELTARAEAAAARIAEASKEALASIGTVASEVAVAMVAKLGGIEADEKAVKTAVKTALSSVKGA